ncbi:CapA family protein [Gracilibacillus alcaliphilus]|uniref:CapA family protein n=1 Tax=Gracilibacillus alcaliphilus TaxID=1401441 RepID=UPI001958A97C|nr:CapA family protein [Gracilibacillus alcaliphilus]MBM7679267.1 poly-gamma-glutamate synthesis protein (capsule biosynthesis protein) [Gracilibacillus alcaliphilus]
MTKFGMMLLTILLLLAGCGESDQTSEPSEQIRTPKLPEKEAVEINPKITVAAVGDILIHDRVYEDAWDGDRYDFLSMMTEVGEYLEEPDITMANQETIMGGEEIGLSGYPSFNSPYEIGDDLQETGVDMVTMANNHTLDRGEQAIRNAIDYYEEIGMEYTGSFKSEADRERIRVLETEQGISIAFLSYTYGTNGISTPHGKDYLVNLIDREQIAQDVEKAEQEADITIVSLHFGQEEERSPNQEQQELAQYAADLGVEVVIGHHPHVLQPMEWIEGRDGKPTLVAYSLGNFLSGQYQFYNRIGGILQFDLVKEKNEVTVQAPRFLPTFVTFDIEEDIMKNVQVVPLEEVPEGQIDDPGQALEEIEAHLSQNMPELEFIRNNGTD